MCQGNTGNDNSHRKGQCFLFWDSMNKSQVKDPSCEAKELGLCAVAKKVL